MPQPARAWLRGVAALLAALALASCTGDDDVDQTDPSPTTTEPAEPDGGDAPDPAAEGAADLSEELTGGNGVFVGSARATDLPAGWVEEERAAAGTATSYSAAGDLPDDGRFDLEPADRAEYRTRVIVRRPSDPDEFNGTVVVEWLNVSGGLDANPGYAYMIEELERGGYAWVGVSAQHVGVEGGQAAVTVEGAGELAGAGLKRTDPERYGSLEHPGDAFAYDLYTQVGRALRSGAGLGELRPERVLAAGQSQSAFALTTYVNGVQPLSGAFDGFLIHSRGASAAPLGAPDAGIDMAAAITGPTAIIRTDLDVPVLVLQSETDLVGFMRSAASRQDDTDQFRLWEVAGTAHADRHLLGPMADGFGCGEVNDGPQHLLVKAALRALDEWVRGGEAPPAGDRIEVAGGEIARDDDGLALGGIRTPQVDVPVVALSGDPAVTDSLICLLFGSTSPLDPARLSERYGSPDAYVQAYEEAADDAIARGFVLPEDREALLAAARPELVPG